MKGFFIPAMAAALLLLTSAQATADVLAVEGVERLPLPAGVMADRTRLSDDGTTIAMSVQTSPALFTYTIANGRLQQLTDRGNITDLSFTQGNNTVVFSRSTYDDKNLRRTGLFSVDRTTGSEKRLAKEARRFEGFSATETGKVIAMANGKRVVKGGERPTAWIDRGRLKVTMPGGRIHEITSVGSDGDSFLWPTVSPDGTHVAFYVAGLGAFVTDIDGSNPRSLGLLRAPAWCGNGIVVGMVDADNGTEVTSSRLEAVTADGSERQVLTSDETMAMYPTATPERIIYTTPTGELYMMNITLKQK